MLLAFIIDTSVGDTKTGDQKAQGLPVGVLQFIVLNIAGESSFIHSTAPQFSRYSS